MSDSRLEECLNDLYSDEFGIVVPSPEETEEIMFRRNAKRVRIRSMARRFREALNPQRCKRLADELVLPAASLEAVGLGWSRDKNCYAFPERDGRGMVIGIALRGKRKQKLFVKRSKRGLTYSKNWDVGDGPIFLVEGATDTAALVAIGLAAVGRPGSAGGVKHLVPLLEKIPAERKIVVVGDNDSKSKVGRDGAIETAKKLSERLGRPIYWTLPPIGYKDSRQWVMAESLNIRGKQGLSPLGRRYIELLLARCERIEPRPFEKFAEQTGKYVQLVDWRAQLAIARRKSVGRHGLYFDGSPTRAGKSFADRVALEVATSSLTLVPTHHNCKELVDELRAAGIAAVAYPKLDEQTCMIWGAAQQVIASGLSVPAALCPRCPLKNRCEYRRRHREAAAAPHAVATHERAAKGFRELARRKQYIAIHENSESLLRPLIKASSGFARVRKVAIDAARSAAMVRPDRRQDAQRFFRRMARIARYLERQLRRAKKTRRIKLPPPCKRPSGTEIDLWRILEHGKARPPAEALRICWALAAGDIAELAVQIDHPLGKGGEILTRKAVVAVSAVDLPTESTIWFCDATGAAAQLEKLIGKRVIDKTPLGQLSYRKSAKQLVRDVTNRTSLKTVAGLLRGILADEECSRIGLIGHRRHICRLLRVDPRNHAGPALEPMWREKIVMDAYFGEGPDRSSNEWHRRCDLIVVLGTPRVPPAAIATQLIRTGQVDAAARDGQWGPVFWEGRDQWGTREVFEGLGYAVPEWNAACRGQVRAELLQCIGRARAISADGINVLVVSNEPCGLTVELSEIIPISATMTRLVAAVNHFATTESPVSTAVAAKEATVSRRKARQYLRAAERLFLVCRKGERGGWLRSWSARD
jgi:hypothetical protein